MKFKNTFYLTLLIFVSFLSLSTSQQAAEKSPELVVAKFQMLLIDTMKAAEKSTVKERYELLAPGVERAFHLPLMIKIITSRHWKTANRNQRHQLKEAFLRMSTATLATLFDGYDGETFRHVSTKNGPSNTKIVTTNLITSPSSRVVISYVTYHFDGGWRIIDAIVDGGISELKIRKSEYSKTLNETGVLGLVELLNKNVSRLLAN